METSDLIRRIVRSADSSRHDAVISTVITQVGRTAWWQDERTIRSNKKSIEPLEASGVGREVQAVVRKFEGQWHHQLDRVWPLQSSHERELVQPDLRELLIRAGGQRRKKPDRRVGDEFVDPLQLIEKIVTKPIGLSRIPMSGDADDDGKPAVGFGWSKGTRGVFGGLRTSGAWQHLDRLRLNLPTVTTSISGSACCWPRLWSKPESRQR